MVHQVSNYYGNQSYPQIQQDYADVKKYYDKVENVNRSVFGNINPAQTELNPVFNSAVNSYKTSPATNNPFNNAVTNPAQKPVSEHIISPDDKNLISFLGIFPQVRRVSSLPDKLQNGDTLSALGLVGLMAVNFPEDCRDVKAAGKQIGSFIKGAKFEGAYNYKELQHPFSFFRGTLLHKFVDPNTTKNPKLAEKLLNADITMTETGFGKKILKFLNIDFVDVAETKIKQIGHTKVNPKFVEAKVFKGNAFGKLTARAMERTPVISLAILAALELPKIFKAMNEGKNIAEQTGNTAKQTVKSGINVASITAGIAYGGAIGSKYGKAFGSLVGMGFGAILGGIASKKVQEVI